MKASPEWASASMVTFTRWSFTRSVRMDRMVGGWNFVQSKVASALEYFHCGSRNSFVMCATASGLSTK